MPCQPLHHASHGSPPRTGEELKGTAMSDDAESTKPKNRGNAGKGRRKGVRNKTTMAAKQAIALAFEGLGGVEGLIAWAKKDEQNERIFFANIYPKLLPLKVDGEVEMGRKLRKVAVRWLARK